MSDPANNPGPNVPDKIQKNFDLLQSAVYQGQVAILRSVNRVTGETAYVIAAYAVDSIPEDYDGNDQIMHFYPLGELVENPEDLYIPPEGVTPRKAVIDTDTLQAKFFPDAI